MDEGRYFVNDILKTKFDSDKVYGKPKCLICGTNLLLDIHHLYKYDKIDLDKTNKERLKKLRSIGKGKLENYWKGYFLRKGIDIDNWKVYKKSAIDKLILLCPTHHHMFHRFIAYYTTGLYVLKPCDDIDKIISRFKQIEKDNIPYFGKAIFYEKGKKVTFHCNHKGKGGGKGGNSLHEVDSLYPKQIIREIPKCIICGYNLVLDLHHINKEKKQCFLCPNHHHMIHRHLGDMKGDKLTLKEIKKGIAEIEKEKKPYYKEISKKEIGEYQEYKRIRGDF